MSAGDNKKVMIYVSYFRNFSVGRSTHVLDLYSSYTDDLGLTEHIGRRESTRITECLKDLALTTIQRAELKKIMGEKMDGIILPDGSYKSR